MNVISKKKKGDLNMLLMSISEYLLLFLPAGSESIEASVKKLEIDVNKIFENEKKKVMETIRHCELPCALPLLTVPKPEVICLLGIQPAPTPTPAHFLGWMVGGSPWVWGVLLTSPGFCPWSSI